MNIPTVSFEVQMSKTLMPLADMPETVTLRTIERSNTAFETVESIRAVPTEVIDSPVEPLDRLDSVWGKNPENPVDRHMYQLPGSPNPPVA